MYRQSNSPPKTLFRFLFSTLFLLLLSFALSATSVFGKEAKHFITPPVKDSAVPDLFIFSGADPIGFSLDPYFSDDQGDAGLSYSIQSNTGSYVTTGILADVCTITVPASMTDTADIILRATDPDGMYIQDTFKIKVVAPEVLFRINAGGVELSSLDVPNMDWGLDDDNSPSIYHNSGNTKGNTNMNTRGAALPAYAPDDLFDQERWDNTPAPEMQWEFPAGVNGIYQVNLFFMNNYGGTSGVGQRVFDVMIEGDTVLDNYDIVADVGHKVGTMKSIQVLVLDGTVDIDFGHVTENPLVNAIEIIGAPVPPSNGIIGASADRVHILETSLGTTSAAYPVTLSNTGTEAITVSSAILTGISSGDFAISSVLPVMLNPGETTNLDITFSPTEVGIASALLEITHNAGNSSPYTITLLGEGTPSGSSGTVLFRVNNGGPSVASGDGSLPAWSEDQINGGTTSGTSTAGSSSPYLITGGTHAHGIATAVSEDGSVPSHASSIIFQTTREDLAGGDEMSWTFPVDSGHLILVRFYFAENSATTAGSRIFDIEVEGTTAEYGDNLDIYESAGESVATIRSCTRTMLDDELDILFQRSAGDPMIAAIEVIDLGLISIDFMGTFTIHENDVNIDKSTYGNNSFRIYNNSDLGGKITSVTLDISTGVMDEMVFDPYGTAGDLIAKDFTIDTDPLITGYASHSLGNPHGTGGYQSVTINFTDFEPGEWFGFSIDVDPSSTEGLPQPGPNDNASVSGLEMIGSTVSFTFSGGTTYSSSLFSDGSNAGAIACVSENIPSAPSLGLLGGGTTATATEIYQTLSITGGEPFGSVSLLEAEAGFFETSPGAQNQLPNEMNSIISTRRISTISLDGSGAGIIKVTTTKLDDEAGYNFYVVATEDGSCFGEVSNPVIVKYTPAGDPVRAFNINGGGDTFVSEGREIFGEDDYYSPSPGKKSNSGTPVGGTNDDEMFQVDNWNNTPFEYEFPTGNGDFEVTLYFAETYYSSSGNRIFQVDAEGVNELADFDIYAQALADPANLTGSGKDYAVSYSFTTTITDGTLNLAFYKGLTGSDNPKINGIQVQPIVSGAFPVIWAGELEGTLQNESIRLNWATASEQNTDGFTVERSVGRSNFELIGSVQSAGNSSSLSEYSFLDVEPQEGLLSYRVRQTDIDGGFIYSNTVELTYHYTGLQLHPNPATDVLNIRSFHKEANTIRVIDQIGKVYFETTHAQNGTITLDTSDLSPGIYMVISTPAVGKAISRRFMKL